MVFTPSEESPNKSLYSILRNEYTTSPKRIGIVLSVGSIFRNIFKTLPPFDSCQVSVILSPIERKSRAIDPAFALAAYLLSTQTLSCDLAGRQA